MHVIEVVDMLTKTVKLFIKFITNYILVTHSIILINVPLIAPALVNVEVDEFG
jgi:hypothetical protein